LNNVSQLAGFAKWDDLKWFSNKLAGMDYRHMPQLAPTPDMLDRYKKEKGDWSAYYGEFFRAEDPEISFSLEPDGYIVAVSPAPAAFAAWLVHEDLLLKQVQPAI